METTQRGLCREFGKTMVPQQKVLRRDAIAWVKARFHGKGKRIGQSIDGMTVNHPNRVNRTFGANEPADIFYRIGSGKDAELRLYERGDSPFYPVNRR